MGFPLRAVTPVYFVLYTTMLNGGKEAAAPPAAKDSGSNFQDLVGYVDMARTGVLNAANASALESVLGSGGEAVRAHCLVCRRDARHICVCLPTLAAARSFIARSLHALLESEPLHSLGVLARYRVFLGTLV